jgi:hypothetical protein
MNNHLLTFLKRKKKEKSEKIEVKKRESKNRMGMG